jgi:hypothetical protein
MRGPAPIPERRPQRRSAADRRPANPPPGDLPRSGSRAGSAGPAGLGCAFGAATSGASRSGDRGAGRDGPFGYRDPHGRDPPRQLRLHWGDLPRRAGRDGVGDSFARRRRLRTASRARVSGRGPTAALRRAAPGADSLRYVTVQRRVLAARRTDSKLVSADARRPMIRVGWVAYKRRARGSSGQWPGHGKDSEYATRTPVSDGPGPSSTPSS